MMNTNNHPMEGPLIQNSLQSVYNGEHDRSWNQKKQGIDFRDMEKPLHGEVSMDAYLAECSVLPPDAKNCIQDALLPDAETIPGNLEMMYPRGFRFSIVILPFMDSGFGKEDLEPDRWESFLNRHEFIKYLTVDPSAQNLTFGLGDVPVYIYDCFPEKIKNDIGEGGCSFDLNYPFPDGDFRNKAWFLERCKTAMNNLGGIIRNQNTDQAGLN